MKIVIAVDSFKGCLSSSSIAKAVEEGIFNTLPECEVIKVPIADGGEGTVEALVDATQGKKITLPVHNPLMQPIHAGYGMTGDGRTAIIEMSAASGLNLIPLKPGNIMNTTTYGTGEMIADAIKRGCRNFIIGVGGSATNDAGTGMMQALGVRFTDDTGKEVEKGGKSLSAIRHIDTQNQLPELQDCTFHIATDVTNPFYGPQGAACIFGPQKGGDEEQIKILDRGMKHLAGLIFETTGKDISYLPGSGAGGGMGGGCVAFLQATISSGIELIMFRRIYTGSRSPDYRRRENGPADLIRESAGRYCPCCSFTAYSCHCYHRTSGYYSRQGIAGSRSVCYIPYTPRSYFPGKGNAARLRLP